MPTSLVLSQMILRSGRWLMVALPANGRFLKQIGQKARRRSWRSSWEKASNTPKVVLINGSTSSDLDLQVSFLPIKGKADMGGGLIWRAADDRNYYLARANPLEQNIRIYRVVKGIRHLLQNFNQTISVKRWHTLRVITRGCQIRVLYDEGQVFDLCDNTFARGRV